MIKLLDILNEGKYHESNDRGIRLAQAIYNNFNAIEATMKHKFKPTEGNENNLKEFYKELKEVLKLAESLVRRPSKNGVKKLEAAHRKWWNHRHGATVVLNGKFRDNIVESVNEAPPKMKKSKEEANINKVYSVVSGLKKGGLGNRYGKELESAKKRALKALGDMATYAKIGV